MIKDILSVAVLVADAEKSAEWYRKKLGFEAETNGHWVTVKPRDSRTVLHLCEKCEEWSGDRPGGQTGIALKVDEIERTCQEMKESGIEFSKELTKAPFGTYAIFKDLDGNEFWIW